MFDLRNFQDSFKMRKLSFISAFSICMAIPLIKREFPLLIKYSTGEVGRNASLL